MKNHKAMTLVEVMIAILLIAVISSAFMVLFPQVFLIGEKGNKVITAVELAQERLEQAESLYHTELHTLVETDTDPFGDSQYKRTTVVGYQIDTVGTNTLTDSDIDPDTSGTQAWEADEWIHYILTIASGTAKGNHYEISDNTGTAITCQGANFLGDGVASGDYYYIGLAPVKVTVGYKISIEQKITPFVKSSSDIGLKDTPAGAEYEGVDKWQNISLETILVQVGVK